MRLCIHRTPYSVAVVTGVHVSPASTKLDVRSAISTGSSTTTIRTAFVLGTTHQHSDCCHICATSRCPVWFRSSVCLQGNIFPILCRTSYSESHGCIFYKISEGFLEKSKFGSRVEVFLCRHHLLPTALPCFISRQYLKQETVSRTLPVAALIIIVVIIIIYGFLVRLLQSEHRCIT